MGTKKRLVIIICAIFIAVQANPMNVDFETAGMDRNQQDEVEDIDRNVESGVQRIEDRFYQLLVKITGTTTTSTAKPSTTERRTKPLSPIQFNESRSDSSSESGSEESTSVGANCRMEGMKNCFKLFQEAVRSESYKEASKALEKCIQDIVKICEF